MHGCAICFACSALFLLCSFHCRIAHFGGTWDTFLSTLAFIFSRGHREDFRSVDLQSSASLYILYRVIFCENSLV